MRTRRIKRTAFASFIMFVVCMEVVAVELRVNNNGGAPYTTIQQAVNAANAGDVIIVEGSNIPYNGNVDVKKRLKITGPGYFLVENGMGGPSVKISGDITFIDGSDGSILAGIEQIDTQNPSRINSVGTGFTMSTTSDWHGPKVTIMEKADQITITNCKLHYIRINNNGGTGIKDIVIAKCWLSPGIIETQSLWSPPVTITIRNCFLRNVSTNSLYDVIKLTENSDSKVSVVNNTFVGKFRIVQIPGKSEVRNNLFFVEQNSSLKQSADNYTNNIYNMAGFGSMGITGNKNPHTDTLGNMLDNTKLRKDWFTCTGDNDLVDHYFINTDYIKDKGAGMFGGEDPYKLAGQTHDPVFAGGATQPVAMHCSGSCQVVNTGPVYRIPNRFE